MFYQRGILILIIAVSALLVSPLAVAQSRCTSATAGHEFGIEKVFGDVKYLQFSGSFTDPRVLFDDYSPDDLIIGIRGDHAYFIIGDFRFDGGFGLTGDSPSVGESGDLRSGILFRIRDIPKDTVLQLKAALGKRLVPSSPTCSLGVCFYLGHVGLSIPMWKAVSPSSLLRHLLYQGITTRDGQKLPTDVIVLTNPNIEAAMKANAAIENRHIEKLFWQALPFGALTSFGALVTYALMVIHH